jgi:hypothetical protein|tara:strand:- start:1905 stop:2375 length:471 start_codon:yes stop_codon:yes gene_type:complete
MRYSLSAVARKNGYRSGLEHSTAEYLKAANVVFLYESMKIEWEDLAYRTYTPDFILPNGIIVETKGLFTAADRRKHRCIKKQHPLLDIRFIFANSKSKIRKGAKSSYGDWCYRYGFSYATKTIPETWLAEKGKNKHPKFVSFSKKKRSKYARDTGT